MLAVSTCLCGLVTGIATLLITRSKERNAAYVQLSMLTFMAVVLLVPMGTVPFLRSLSPLEVYPRLFFGLGSSPLPAAVYALGAVLSVRMATRAYGIRTG